MRQGFKNVRKLREVFNVRATAGDRSAQAQEEPATDKIFYNFLLKAIKALSLRVNRTSASIMLHFLTFENIIKELSSLATVTGNLHYIFGLRLCRINGFLIASRQGILVSSL